MEPHEILPPNKFPLSDTYLTERQLAEQLPNGTVRKLRAWRNRRVGPPWLRIGREIAYLRDTVEAWMKSTEHFSREHRSDLPVTPTRTAGRRPRR